MASQSGHEVVITGASELVVAPRASISPTAWAGTPAKLARMDRLCALGLVACDGALRDARLSPTGPEWNGDRTAVVLGTAFGCHATNEDYYRGVLADFAMGASPRLFAYTLPSSPVGEVSIHFGIRGPAAAVTSGLHAGLDALRAGLRELESGRADRVLVASAEVATPLLERWLRTPLSDVGAALVLERASDAAARGATVLGRVRATAAAYSAGDRGAAVLEAARRTLAHGDGPGTITEVLACAADAEAVRAIGVSAPARDQVPAALGAAPLIALARRLHEARGRFLSLVGDPEGGAAGALVDASA
jgi:3-oxoacyl-[acyl-carrier-protein] synthase II